ncbi:thymidine phosphorylase [Aliirhizobium terrae]|uniref:thymidine phosphorylase n=1 Tax=Terrirhizobium terrae TaxID=2926709 RepID=UPI0025774CDE|nr:thymidine phosphorylase [Rhizobium sp. CC-CFT758]WJH41899.1 thymidine phosphorylase [Rhizobium sp. CC-CFT758]
MVLPQEIIRRKRDGQSLSRDEIATFIEGVTGEGISEAQVAAFAMAVFFRGMSRDETVALTLAMRDSGSVLRWSGIDRPIADKHSTGGVGDNVSLMLAPIAAACGLAVPMISGRGLGHTGGTLDKLQSIPGYDIAPDEARFVRTVRDVGCAIVGQTADLAPADRRLYAIRDVTATVESVPLITASILSKKLAAGLRTLLMDVKVGTGAFMQDIGEARVLARSLVEVAGGAGVPTAALITDMNEPLADAAGNTLEIANCVGFLAGQKSGTRLETVVLAEAAEMLLQARLVSSASAGECLARQALTSGRAMETFARMVHALGGPTDFCDRPEAYLPSAPIVLDVLAPQDGYLAACDARALGLAVVDLGGGRRKVSDPIDHRVGLNALLPLGSPVSKGQPIARVHAASQEQAEQTVKTVLASYRIDAQAPEPSPVIIERIG